MELKKDVQDDEEHIATVQRKHELMMTTLRARIGADSFTLAANRKRTAMLKANTAEEKGILTKDEAAHARETQKVAKAQGEQVKAKIRLDAQVVVTKKAEQDSDNTVKVARKEQVVADTEAAVAEAMASGDPRAGGYAPQE